MFLLTLDTLTAAHSDYAQYAEPDGTVWLCTGLEGWFRAPARKTRHADYETADGAFRSAAYRGTRAYTVAGRFFAPTPVIGVAKQRRVLALCPDPGMQYPLTVQERDGLNALAYVEQANEILCEQAGPHVWDFSVPLVASDPYRYSAAWATVGPSSAGVDGVSGIATSGSGVVSSTPGIATGTAPTLARVTVTGSGTVENGVVLQVTGITSGVQVADLGGVSIVGVRGAIAAGESIFINTGSRTAFDVPGCPIPILPHGAVLGGASARSAVWVSGGWPVVKPGEIHTFLMTGNVGVGAALTVHTRGAYV